MTFTPYLPFAQAYILQFNNEVSIITHALLRGDRPFLLLLLFLTFYDSLFERKRRHRAQPV